ncbi:MAG: RcnB family protein [Alphaproteobacteria bacterium]|nr:RcnB family protein [Alphaproteobacteria bacterium]
MKKLLVSAAALAILSAPVAMADDNDNNSRHQGQHEKATRDSGPDRSSDRGATPDTSGGPRPRTMSGSPDTDNGPHPRTTGGNPDTDNGPRPRTTGGRPGADNDRPRDMNDNDSTVVRNRGDNDKTVIRNNDNDKTVIRNNDNDRTVNKTVNKTVVRKTVDRGTVLKFRANITASHRYHFARAYVRPAGFYPHRWVFGERLPRAFFAPDYFILDFAAYGLIEPWSGYEWVRYGDDALLIDVETGEVIRVEYGLFY